MRYFTVLSWGSDFHRFMLGFLSMIIYEVLYTLCLRYSICSALFLDIRTSTCSFSNIVKVIVDAHIILTYLKSTLLWIQCHLADEFHELISDAISKFG